MTITSAAVAAARACAVLAACTTFVHAQPAEAPRPADPLDAGAAVPAAAYRSAFGGYRSQSEQEVGSWRSANDTVGAIGGWRTYAREIAGTPAAAPGAPTGVPPVAPASNSATPSAAPSSGSPAASGTTGAAAGSPARSGRHTH
jgi:hypothetical protein